MSLSSNLNASIEARAIQAKGVLPQEQLFEIGKEAATVAEIITQLFLAVLRVFKEGFQSAVEKRKQYFIEKSIAPITDYNLQKLAAKVNALEPEQRMAYLISLQLQLGEVLLETSRHWESIQEWHAGYQCVQQAKGNLQTHWLSAFAQPDDLGKQLELVDPFADQALLRFIAQLDHLQKENSGPHFVPLIRVILGGGTLKKVTSNQIEDVKYCLVLYHLFPLQTGKERIDQTRHIFDLLKRIDAKEQEAFVTFLSTNPVILQLLARLELSPKDPHLPKKLAQLPELAAQISSLPVDLAFSTSVDDLIGKCQQELPANDKATRVTRYGQKFAAHFEACPDKASLQASLKKLEQIETQFRLCGRGAAFIASINQALGSGFRNAQEFDLFVQKLIADNENEFHLYAKLGELTKKYSELGVPSVQIRKFQSGVIAIGDSERVVEAAVQFNKEQLALARKEWSGNFGAGVADMLYKGLSDDVRQGKVHFKEQNYVEHLEKLAEINRTAVKFNLANLKAEYGEVFAFHVMSHFIVGPAKTVLADPEFFKTWSTFLQQLQSAKRNFISQGASEAQFHETLEAYLSTFFLREKPFLNSDAMAGFVRFFQLQLNKKTLGGIETSYGKLFAASLTDYLSEHEQEVLSGERPLNQSLAFLAENFPDQVRFLKPYLLKNLHSLEVLDERFVDRVLFVEPLTSEILQNRIDNLQRLNEYGKSAETPRQKAMVKALISALIPPYLIKPDLNYNAALRDQNRKKGIEEELNAARDAVSKLTKFCCGNFDPHEIYPPALVAQAALKFVQGQAKPSLTPAQALHSAVDKCDAFFNGSAIEAFHVLCLRLYVEDAAQAVCEKLSQPYEGEIAALVDGLLARFDNQKQGVASRDSAAYIRDLVDFAVSLSLTTGSKSFDVIQALVDETPSGQILLDLEQIKKKGTTLTAVPQDVKAKLTAKLKKSLGTPDTSVTLIKSIEKNPFGVVGAFVPRLLENLLEPEDQHRVAGIRKSLIPLKEAFNQSPLVNRGVRMLKVAAAASELLPEEAEPTNVKEYVVKLITGFNALDIDELAKLGKRDEINKRLDQKKLGAVGAICNVIVDKMVDANSKKHPKKTATKPVTDKDPFLEFFTEALPDILDVLKTIQTWLSKYPGLIPIIRTSGAGKYPGLIPIIRTSGAGWLINKILNQKVFSNIDFNKHLDAQTKKLVTESLVLAAPSILEKHQLDAYIDFFAKLKAQMQSEKPIDQEALYIEVMKILQQFTRECVVYGPLLEDALSHAIAQSK